MTSDEAFGLLNLPSTATSEQITKAWRQACMRHHPDREGGNQHDFLQAKEAFHTAMIFCSTQKCGSCLGTGKITISVGLTKLSIKCPKCSKINRRSR